MSDTDSDDDDMDAAALDGGGGGGDGGGGDESHDEDTQSSRFDSSGPSHTLPFHPQKLIKANKFIPFSVASVDDEAVRWFGEIKYNLARAFAFYEWRPGAMIWASRLEAYISLHGMKFSKDDHIAMIRMVYEVVTTKEKMEPGVLMRLIGLLSLLTHRIELLSPDDLQLAWRPLYEVYERYEMNNHDDAVGLEFMPESFGLVLANCIHHCRVYFPLEATQEMLEEWRPKMCPYSDSIEQAMAYFEMFLPTVIRNKEKNAAMTYGLWFDELMTWWLSMQHNAPWESVLITLLSRLAVDTIGYIDWRPYISQIFDRYLYCINLPTGRLSTRPRIGNQTFDAISGPVWITSMLHMDECIDALRKLINATETYFYPSNSGGWAPALCQAILTIPSTIVARLAVERHSKRTNWKPSPPAHAHLRDEQIERIVGMYKPILLIAIYRRSAIERMSVFPCLASLVQLQPKMMVVDVIDNFYASIETLDEPGRFLSALNALNFCIKEVVRVPETRRHVLPILEALLPAMDVNDFRKTIASMNVIYNLLLLINLHDCSAQAATGDSQPPPPPPPPATPTTPARLLTTFGAPPPLTDDERELCLATAGFQEISLLILDRCLSYLENCSMDTHLISETVSKDEVISMNSEEMPVRGLMVNTILTLALVSNDRTVRSLCDRLATFISTTILDSRHFSGGTLCTICHHLARVKPQLVSERVLRGGSGLVRRVLMRLQEMSNVLTTKTHMDAETCWLVSIVVDFVCGHPKLIVENLSDLREILALTIPARCRRIARSGGALLGGALRALTDIQIDTAAAYEPRDPITVREWGKLYHVEDLQVRWQLPTAATIAAAQELIDMFVAPLLQRLLAHAQKKQELSRIELEQTLYSVERAVAGASLYSHFGAVDAAAVAASTDDPHHHHVGDEDERPVQLPCSSAVRMYGGIGQPSAYPDESKQRPELQGFTITVNKTTKQFRRAVFNVLNALQQRLLASDDNKSMQELVRIYKSLLFDRGRTSDEYNAKRRNQALLRPFIFNQTSDRRLQPKQWHLGKIALQYEKRLVAVRALDFTVLRREITDSLLRLSVSRYRGVRQLAQGVFSEVAATFKFVYLLYVEDIVALLEKAHDRDDDESQLKGALHLLVDMKTRCWLIKHHWPSIRRIWPALVRAQSRHSDRPLFSNLLLVVADVMERAYTTTAIFERELPSVVDCAREWLAQPFAGQTASTITEAELAVVRERARKQEKENIECYNGVVRELAMLISSKQLQNSNQLFAEFLLTMLPRADVPFPVEATDVILDAFINPSSYRSRQTITLAIFALLRKTKPQLKRISVRQYVRQYRNIPIDELDNNNMNSSRPVLGVRNDNEWLCFDDKNLPTDAEGNTNAVTGKKSGEKFNSTFFIDKEWIGYNGWPAEHYTIAAPLSEQNLKHLYEAPQASGDNDEMATSVAIYQKFVGISNSNDEVDKRYLDRVVQLLSIEDQEYHARFNPNNANLWIFLCRNFGIVIMHRLLPYIDVLLDGRKDHQQRCAAEMLCGIICGAKRWPYEMITEMHAELGKRIEKALQFVSVETQTDWGEFAINCFTMGDNARRHYPLYRLLLTIRSASAATTTSANNSAMAPLSFNIATRIYLAQCTFFAAHDWRRRQLHYQMLETLKPHFDQAYRDRVGSALASIFSLNNGLPYLNTQKDQGPKLSDFMREYLPQCVMLLQNADNDNNNNSMVTDQQQSINSVDKERHNMLTFECIVRMTISHIDENRMHPLEENQFELFPLLCRYESDAKDERLRTSCRIALALLAGHLIPDAMFDLVLKHAERVANATSTSMPWRGRVVALHFLQAIIFNNLMLIHSRPASIRSLRELVTARLCDAQIEVREAASELLTGLFRCGILPIDSQTVDTFKALATTRIKRSGVRRTAAQNGVGDVNVAAESSGGGSGDSFVKRHAGVLGLCACVLSHPYSVPEYMPEILMSLREHLQDPPPMQTTTRKALYEFKRTHASQWQEHKQKFSDDQLAMLTDLLVSPNYYA